MSEMSLFKSGAAIPDYLVSGPSDITRALAGSGTKKISIRGGVFRMMSGGQQLAINEDRSMNFIVVDAAPAVSRTFYSGPYNEAQDHPPACWSDDGVAPSPTAYEPQCKTCAMCPQNAKGSGTGDSRACRFSQRLVVALEGDIAGGGYGIQLPAMSVFGASVGRYSPLQEYAKKLASFNVSLEKVVTEFRFDTQAQVPKLFFQAVRPLTQDEYNQVLALQKEDHSALIGPRDFPAPESDADEAEENPASEDEDEVEPPPPAAPKAKARSTRSKEEKPPVVRTPAATSDPAENEDADASKGKLAQLLEEWADD